MPNICQIYNKYIIIVSEADLDFDELEPWEIPGLPFDFGDGVDIKDATAMLTNNWLEKGLTISSHSNRSMNF